MALRSGGRKLSFDILNADDSFDGEILLERSISDPIRQNDVDEGLSAHGSKSNRRKRKKKKKKMIACSIVEDPITDKVIDAVFDEQKPLFYENKSCANDLDPDYQNYRIQTIVCEEITVLQESNEQVRTVNQFSEPDYQNLHDGRQPLVELRQRTVNGIGACDESLSHTNEPAKEDNSVELGSLGQRKPDSNGSVIRKLKTADSLDWKRLIAEDPSYLSSVEKSPVKYFLEEVYGGNSLRSTTTLGNEKERERVYDTIFRLPWRCELLICVGFFVCLDSFLSLLTIMPTRFLMTCWRYVSTRQFQKPSAADLSDLGCFIVLACGVTLLQGTDISLIYHMIRGQGTIKLYVVYNVLEIFDKLFQNFGGDVMQTLFNSAEGLSNSAPEKMRFWLWRFISDQMLAVVASIAHSFVLLAQAITLSTCIVAHNNALLALLVSNNFAEIKSNVFKRLSKGNIHNLVYHDSVERFHISAFLLFVLAQNILEAEGPWFGSFIYNAFMVYYCEMMIDIIKHSFIAKFNEIKPIAYSEFLEDLCRQTLNIQGEDEKKTLTFVPLAPACVVIRVLTPVYAAHLPYGPLPWRLLWIFLLSIMTCVMLTSLKVLIGMCLHKHATWYVDRCQKRKHHFHAD